MTCRIGLAVAVLVAASLAYAAPAPPAPAAPAAPAAKVAGATAEVSAIAAEYWKNLGKLFFQLEFVGMEEEKYTSAILTTTEVTRTRIDQAQAKRLLDYLAADGVFARAKVVPHQDDHDGEFPGLEGPCYALTIRAEGCPTMREAMGWGPPLVARLEALRKVVEGAAGGEIDAVLTDVTGQAAWSQPASGLRARLKTYGFISKRLGLWVQVEIENVSDKPLAVDLGMLEMATFTLPEDQKPETERTRPRTVSWTVLRPGDTALRIIGKSDLCRDGRLDLGLAVWNLKPGPSALWATISDDGSQPGKPEVAAAWSGKIALTAAPFWVYSGKTADEIAAATAKIRKERASNPEAMWKALAELVEPGMTVKEMKAILPPDVTQTYGGGSDWTDNLCDRLFYPLDDTFYVLAVGFAPIETDKMSAEIRRDAQAGEALDDAMILTLRPEIRRYPVAPPAPPVTPEP